MTSFEEFEEFYSKRKDITPIYKIALDKKLPDVLNWNDIAELWASKLNRPENRDDFLNIKNRRFEWILEAVRNEELQTHIIDCGMHPQGIERNNFISWLKKTKRWEQAQNTLLANWWATVVLKDTTFDNAGNPWLEQNPQDPTPEYEWHTPARYFARKLVTDDTTLLTKRDILAQKVVNSLSNVGILKRGNKKPFAAGTIKKALTNIKLG